MDREFLQQSAKGWIMQANADIRGKIMEMMDKYGVMPRQLANTIGENEAEINGILDGTRDVSLETFVKILIATGNILEIKQFNEQPQRQPTRRTDTRRPIYTPPTPPRFGNIFDSPNSRPHFYDLPQDEHTPTMEPMFGEREGRQAESPFDTMPRPRLIEIIKDKLWDSEIDTTRATHAELADFLKAKDRRIKARQRRNEENEVSDEIKNLRDKIKDTIERKPQFREYLKKYIL